MNDSTTVLGIDFTSAPSRRKPITCVRTRLKGNVLEYVDLVRWSNYREFESALEEPGPWVAGIDFPFGQARRFIENMGWPLNWSEYVRLVGSLDRAGFRDALEDYKRDRSVGDKHHKRACDRIARSQSPQTLFGTPVGLMFFEGTPRLLRAGVRLPYHDHGDGSRIVLEAYPGIAARNLVGNRSYKSDQKQKQTQEQARARRAIWTALTGKEGKSIYGLAVSAPQELVVDPGGDDLDGLLCSVQAAWGWRRRHREFGAPPSCDRLEGWISDPATTGS